MSELKNIEAVAIEPGTWHVFPVSSDGKRGDKPLATIVTDGEGFKVYRGSSGTDHVSLAGPLERILASIDKTMSRTGPDRVLLEYYEASLGNMNVLAARTTTTAAFIVALARALADTLHEDVKADKVASMRQTFNEQVEERMEQRAQETDIKAAISGLVETLFASHEPKH